MPSWMRHKAAAAGLYWRPPDMASGYYRRTRWMRMPAQISGCRTACSTPAYSMRRQHSSDNRSMDR